MKIHKLIIHNIILNAIKLCFGGSFPDNIITNEKVDGFVKLEFDDSSICREFIRKDDGSIKAKPILFVKDNQIVNKPVEVLRKFINPFLLDQDYLIRMTEHERKKYFCDLFDVCISKLEANENTWEKTAKELRAHIKGIGDINPIEVEKPNIANLIIERKNIKDKEQEALERFNEETQKAQDTFNKVQGAKFNITQIDNKIEKLSHQIEDLKHEKEYHQSVIEVTEVLEFPLIFNNPVEKELVEVEEKISNAKADEVRYDNYLKDIERLESKKGLEKQLKETTNKLKEVRENKLKKLAEITDNSKIEGLEFIESGDFKFEGVSAGMLSTSQLMTLSSLLTKLYPESFDIELIDKGESLGRRVFELVDRAEKEERTILTTIVGDRPADIPENIGVFVVKDGKIL